MELHEMIEELENDVTNLISKISQYAVPNVFLPINYSEELENLRVHLSKIKEIKNI